MLWICHIIISVCVVFIHDILCHAAIFTKNINVTKSIINAIQGYQTIIS